MVGSGPSNVIYLNATSSVLGCGWSACLSGGGVIGCGGPQGRRSPHAAQRHLLDDHQRNGRAALVLHVETSTARSLTQSVIEHELGHTLGLGYLDAQNVSVHFF